MRFKLFAVALCFVTGCNSAKELPPRPGGEQEAATTAGKPSDPNLFAMNTRIRTARSRGRTQPMTLAWEPL